MKKKKMNVWVKTALILLVSAVCGGVIGFIGAWFLDGKSDQISTVGHTLLTAVRQMAIPAMIVVMIITITYEEWNIHRMRKIGHMILTTEDEECDKWEYQLEKISAIGTGVNTASMVASILILTTGYSLRYIEEGHALTTLILCAIFLVCYVYDCYWQIRLVKETQKIFPQLQGDPSSVKFHQQWLESCDEAEKEYIYQSAYKCYIQMGKWIQILLLITMLGQLMFNTGIMAIIVVGVIWLVMTITYLKSCVQLKGKGLEK